LISEDFANFQDVFSENFRLYVGVRPQGVHEFVMSHQPARMLDQVA
jgi:hypothetical protein